MWDVKRRAESGERGVRLVCELLIRYLFIRHSLIRYIGPVGSLIGPFPDLSQRQETGGEQ